MRDCASFSILMLKDFFIQVMFFGRISPISCERSAIRSTILGIPLGIMRNKCGSMGDDGRVVHAEAVLVSCLLYFLGLY